MFITVQFKDAKKNFRGRTYDYELCRDEAPPRKDSVIRMMDEDYDYICHGTRVKVVGIKDKSETANVKIRWVEASMED